MLSPDEILSASATPASGVLLSARTQQVALSAISYIQSREVWDEMSDTSWDEIDAATSEAIHEIITEVPQGGEMSVQRISVARKTNQVFAANTEAAIIWGTGDFDPSNTTRIVIPQAGLAIATFMGNFTSANNHQVGLRYRKNGAAYYGFEQSITLATNHRLTSSWVHVFDSAGYLEVFAVQTQAGVLNVSLYDATCEIMLVEGSF